MGTSLRSRFLLALAVPALCGLAGAQVSVENVQRLLASDGSGGNENVFDPPAGDHFGYAIAVSGDSAFIGAPYHSGAGMHAGALYLFRRAGTSWVEEGKLLAADAAPWDFFGTACAVSGDRLVVSATGNAPDGAVYIYRWQDRLWVQEARRFRPNGFGQVVAIDGDTCVASASDATYVFSRSGSTWIEEAVLVPDDGPVDGFGLSVAIRGDIAVVGAPWDDAVAMNSGSAYVFRRQGTAWSQVAKLIGGDTETFDLLGASVAIGEGLLAIGAPYAGTGGAVYVFEQQGGTWSQRWRLRHPDALSGDQLGYSLSLCGDALAAGAPGDLAAYLFVYDGLDWQQRGRVTAFDGPPSWSHLFATRVATDGDALLVGSPGDDSLEPYDSGAAFLYSIQRRAGRATCFGMACPCGNPDPSAGCANSTGVGGSLVGTGSRSVSCEHSLEFTATQLPQPTSGLLYMGDAAVAAPLLDGIQCAGGAMHRLTGLMQAADGAGAITFGPGVLGVSGDLIDPGETWHFQAFYRDVAGSPCGAGANLTNAYSVTFLP